jgi:hypothetical protein
MQNRLNFNAFRNAYPNYNHLSDEWLEWFIGFFEGDGSLICTSKDVQFVITQYEPNIKVLIDIQNKFNFGRVIVQAQRLDRAIHTGKAHKEAVYRYIVQDLKSLHVISSLLNDGNLVLPIKRHKFVSWLENYNTRLINAKKNRPEQFKDLDFIKLSLKETFCFKEDAWLSGFTDADGSFSFSLLSNSRGFRLRYLLSTKNYKGTEKLITHINKEFFDCTGDVRLSNNMWNLSIGHIKNINIVYCYFDRFYPRCPTKLRMYLIHKIICEKLINKDHLNCSKRSEMDMIWRLISTSKRSLE